MKDPVVIILVIISIVIGTIIVIFAGRSSGNDSASTKDEAAVFEISNKVFPLIPGTKIEQKDIEIGNSGTNPLYIDNFSLSEGIKVKVISKTNESPEIIGSRKWKGTLNPNGGGIIRVSFLADKIDWQSPADQYIRFKTNDPKNQNVEIIFTTDLSKVPIKTETTADSTKSTDSNSTKPDSTNQNIQDLFK